MMPNENSAIPPRPYRVTVSYVVGLLGLWLLLSGKTDGFHIAVGVASVAFAIRQTKALRPLEEVEPLRLKHHRLPAYGLWLLLQMLLSALHVAKVILKPGKYLDPALVELESRQPSILGHVIFANSITLTPGTLSADLKGSHLVVHTLTEKTARDLVEGDMHQRVMQLFVDNPVPPGTPDAIPQERK